MPPTMLEKFVGQWLNKRLQSLRCDYWKIGTQFKEGKPGVYVYATHGRGTSIQILSAHFDTPPDYKRGQEERALRLIADDVWRFALHLQRAALRMQLPRFD